MGPLPRLSDLQMFVFLGLISLAQMAAMIKAVFFHHRIETAVLILPIATMIAFAQLRGSFPNAPMGFGKPFSHPYTSCPLRLYEVSANPAANIGKQPLEERKKEINLTYLRRTDVIGSLPTYVCLVFTVCYSCLLSSMYVRLTAIARPSALWYTASQVPKRCPLKEADNQDKSNLWPYSR